MDMKFGLICLLVLLQGSVLQSMKTLKDGILEVHNAVRRDANLTELEWDEGLVATMTKLLTTLKSMDNCPFKHSDEVGLREEVRPHWEGENLFATSSLTTPEHCLGMSASLAWYNEIRHYRYPGENVHYSKDNDFMKTGHFTSMMWHSVKKIGCATISCPDRVGWNNKTAPRTIVGCHAFPGSNYQGSSAFKQINWELLIATPNRTYCCEKANGETSYCRNSHMAPEAVENLEQGKCLCKPESLTVQLYK